MEMDQKKEVKAPLPLDFYLENDVVSLGKKLLGKILFTHLPSNEITGGIIIETESYAGITDRASHAYGNKRTPRTEAMFQTGGIAYVYLCYGMHHLLNVVTNEKDIPHAVLIRALHPLYGIETMGKRCNKSTSDASLTSGPGSLAKALGITMKQNRTSLASPEIWIEDYKTIPEKNILAGPRIGVTYAKEDALLPYRFQIKNLWF